MLRMDAYWHLNSLRSGDVYVHTPMNLVIIGLGNDFSPVPG